MTKFLKKAFVLAMAATLTFGSTTSVFAATASPVVSEVKPKAEKNVKAEKKNGVTATVTTSEKGTAKVTSIVKTTKKTITISSKLTVDGVDYKVTTISAKAFANCTKAEKISLPSTITKIEKSAFSNLASSVKTITFANKKAITVNKGAFKGTDTKKITIQVSASMSKTEYKKFVKALKAAGFKGTIKQETK